jgi:hypothetical protein
MLGLILGFLVGMLWWASLIIALGSLAEVVYAPLVALPWAIIGAIVGAVSTYYGRGYWVPAMAALGTIAGGAYSLATNPFDGWLVLSMPVDCWLGTFVGMVLGLICSALKSRYNLWMTTNRG